MRAELNAPPCARDCARSAHRPCQYTAQRVPVQHAPAPQPREAADNVDQILRAARTQRHVLRAPRQRCLQLQWLRLRLRCRLLLQWQLLQCEALQLQLQWRQVRGASGRVGARHSLRGLRGLQRLRGHWGERPGHCQALQPGRQLPRARHSHTQPPPRPRHLSSLEAWCIPTTQA